MATWTKWTETEEATLLNEIKTIKSIQEIAKKHNRTPGAIRARLQRIFIDFVLEGKSCPSDLGTFLKQKPHCETQSTITMEFKETFNRAKLQGLAEENRIKQLAWFIDHNIANHVTGAATQGKTSFLYERSEDTNPLRHTSQQGPTDEQLMIGLVEKFPGCTIGMVEEWVDVASFKGRGPPTRVLKRGIKIDWS